MSLLSGLWAKLRDKAYRRGYADNYVSMLVPFQIRALRKSREWTLPDLAKRSGIPQDKLECLEEAGYNPQDLGVLYKIAKAFDIGVLVEFVPFSKLVSREETFQPETFDVASFSNDKLVDIKAATVPQEINIPESPGSHFANKELVDLIFSSIRGRQPIDYWSDIHGIPIRGERLMKNLLESYGEAPIQGQWPMEGLQDYYGINPISTIKTRSLRTFVVTVTKTWEKFYDSHHFGREPREWPDHSIMNMTSRYTFYKEGQYGYPER